MEQLTSVCLVTHVRNSKRLKDLQSVLTSLINTLVAPCEVVVVDDVSPRKIEVEVMLTDFRRDMEERGVPVHLHFNEKNLKHAASQNKSMELAKGDCLIHIEDDCLIDRVGWNQVFAKCLRDHPEVGQVLPAGSGRGEWIPRGDMYREFQWGIGGIWAVRKEVFDTVGGWDEVLSHQIEPDYNFRVRMAGWRLAEIPEFHMVHLGEGDEADTFERQAQITIGVYNFLKKWNRRLMGFYGYHTVPCFSPDDFCINVFFRRQLAAWYASEGERIEQTIPDHLKGASSIHQDMKRCRLNASPEPFKFPGHWGEMELIKLIRPKGRERENELIEKMENNHVWKDAPELHKQIRELSERFFKAGKIPKAMDDDEVEKFLEGKEYEFTWTYEATPCKTPRT